MNLLQAETAIGPEESAGELFDRLKEESIRDIEMEELSMGMSGDYRLAAAHGATMVRVGSAIFGPRG